MVPTGPGPARLASALVVVLAASCCRPPPPHAPTAKEAPASQLSYETPLPLTLKERREELEFLRQVLKESYAHYELKQRQWGVDDDDLLRRYWPHFEEIKTFEEYDSLMLRLLHEFHDAHLSYQRVRTGGRAGRHTHVRYTVGLRTVWLGGQLIVSEVRPGSSAAAAGLVTGDRIVAIRGRSATSYLARRVNRRAWSRSAAAWYDAARLFLPLVLEAEDQPRPLRLAVETARGATRAVALPLVRRGHRPPRSAMTLTLQDGIALLRLRSFGRRVDRDQITAHYRRIVAEAKGLILDLRGNRGGIDLTAHAVLGHLVEAPAVIGTYRVRMSKRTLAARGRWRSLTRQADGFSETVTVEVKPRAPRFRGPVVALLDVGCRSSCETLAAGLRTTGAATLVGERTAGCSGAPIKVRLPHSGALVGIPTWLNLTAEGQPLEGLGVAPDEEVPLTRQAVARGVDPALERARAILRARVAATH